MTCDIIAAYAGHVHAYERTFQTYNYNQQGCAPRWITMGRLTCPAAKTLLQWQTCTANLWRTLRPLPGVSDALRVMFREATGRTSWNPSAGSQAASPDVSHQGRMGMPGCKQLGAGLWMPQHGIVRSSIHFVRGPDA